MFWVFRTGEKEQEFKVSELTQGNERDGDKKNYKTSKFCNKQKCKNQNKLDLLLLT